MVPVFFCVFYARPPLAAASPWAPRLEALLQTRYTYIDWLGPICLSMSDISLLFGSAYEVHECECVCASVLSLSLSSSVASGAYPKTFQLVSQPQQSVPTKLSLPSSVSLRSKTPVVTRQILHVPVYFRDNDIPCCNAWLNISIIDTCASFPVHLSISTC